MPGSFGSSRKYAIAGKSRAISPRFASSFLLDGLPFPPVVALSLNRRLNKNYNGNIFKLKRSDGQIQSFGLTGNEVDYNAVLAFSQGTKTDIIEWYDQSINGFVFTSDSGAEPELIDSLGNLNLLAGKPTINLSSGGFTLNNFHSGQLVTINRTSIFGFFQRTSTQDSFLIYTIDSNLANPSKHWGIIPSSGINGATFFDLYNNNSFDHEENPGGRNVAVIDYSQPSILSYLRDSNFVYFRKNGQPLFTQPNMAPTPFVGETTTLSISGTTIYPNSRFFGNLSELIVFNDYVNPVLVETNINNYYTAY